MAGWLSVRLRWLAEMAGRKTGLMAVCQAEMAGRQTGLMAGWLAAGWLLAGCWLG